MPNQANVGMTDIQFKVRVLTIGQALARQAWWEMSAQAAEDWAAAEARRSGIQDERLALAVALGAMEFVLANLRSAPQVGELLDQAEMADDRAPTLDELAAAYSRRP